MAASLTYISKPSLQKLVDKEKESKENKVISFSQYSKYFKCPKSWELNYIKKIKQSDESIDLVFGQAMHSVIQQWLKTIYTVTVKKANEMDLHKMLMDELSKEYKERKEKFGKHFSTPEELSSYYTDGCEILEYLKKKRAAYFSTRKTKLIAIEFPLYAKILDDYPLLRLTGSIDLIFYNEVTKKYLIVDIKTSTRGWNDYKKKDELTTDQILIYKKYLAEILKTELDFIDVVFFIVKRKLNPDSLWPQKRIQEFSPASGKVSINRVSKNLTKFVQECFNKDGTYNTEHYYPPIAGPNFKNCMFCIYDDKEDVCPKAKRICQ